MFGGFYIRGDFIFVNNISHIYLKCLFCSIFKFYIAPFSSNYNDYNFIIVYKSVVLYDFYY